MSSKSGHSKKILKILAEKPAISLDSIKMADSSKTSYALSRALKNLIEGGYAEVHNSGREDYVKITKKGKNKVNSLLLGGAEALTPLTWDGLWRIIILSLDENRKNEREALRYLLKKANFVCVKNTVWISPYPYEHLFTNIKKDLGLTTELMIIVTDKLDPETSKSFLEAIKN